MSRRTIAMVLAAIGVGLCAAPAVFGMFDAAPKGGRMIQGFKPYMTQSVITRFGGYLDRVGRVVEESQPGDGPQTTALVQKWPGIQHDMRDELLTPMGQLLPNFKAVAALPPFPLFPWFFVAPGVMLLGIAVWFIRGAGRGPTVAAVLLGLGLVAAPAIFQMWHRAPLGETMISRFKPIMTQSRVLAVQQAFLTIGNAEGELRTSTLVTAGSSRPAAREFSDGWQVMSADMAPMIGAMSDNLSTYHAVAGLPPFGLFPWFFVIPGALVAATGGFALRRPTAAPLPMPQPERIPA